MTRACFLLALAALLVCGGQLPTIRAQETGQTKKLDLKQQLEQGLRARRPVEFAFIARVVHEVEQGRLSRSLVDGIFGWARKKSRHRFQYFEFAMRRKAAKLGVDL